MDNPQTHQQPPESSQPNKFEGLLWIILFLLVVFMAAIVIQRNWVSVSKALGLDTPLNFDQVMSSQGLHDINLENGRAYDISYETSSKREFTGLVRHTSSIREPSFAILTFDILVTSGDFANADLVTTNVSNHHFSWRSLTTAQPHGAINLLHTVPINEEINQALKSIQNGDNVRITGYDIYQIQGFNAVGEYIGSWQDYGCNTTLVTKVEILE